MTLGKYPALTLKNARIKRDEAAQAAAMGTSPAQQKQLAKVAAADATTVSEFGERFFREIVAKDRQNLTSPRRYFDKAILPAIGMKSVRDVTTEDVHSIIWRKKDEGLDAAAGVIRGFLRRLFDYWPPRTRCWPCPCATADLTQSGVLGGPRAHRLSLRRARPSRLRWSLRRL